MKDPVFLVIHMCQMVKARESVGRRAKPAARPRKFACPIYMLMCLSEHLGGGGGGGGGARG